MVMYAFVSSPLNLIINSWPNRKLLCYPILQQIRDVLPTVAVSLVMCGVVYGARVLLNSIGVWTYCGDWLLIPLVFIGVVVFVGLSIMFRLKAAVEYVNLLRGTPLFKVRLIGFLARKLGVMG